MGVRFPLLASQSALRPAPPRPAPELLPLSIVFYGLLLTAALLWAWLADGRMAFFHPGVAAGLPSVPGLAVGIGLGLATVLGSRLIARLFGWARRMHDAIHPLVQGVSWSTCVVLALASSVGEEVFFRGALQPAVGLWWSALIFGLVHLPMNRSLGPWPLMAGVLGLAFGLIFERFGDLGGPIAAHFLINLINLHHIAHHRYGTAPPEPTDGQKLPGSRGLPSIGQDEDLCHDDPPDVGPDLGPELGGPPAKG